MERNRSLGDVTTLGFHLGHLKGELVLFAVIHLSCSGVVLKVYCSAVIGEVEHSYHTRTAQNLVKVLGVDEHLYNAVTVVAVILAHKNVVGESYFIRLAIF